MKITQSQQNDTKSNSPKISVVIPAYNEEKLIEKTLQSLSRQTFKNFEIIVVDNNSTDKTAAIAKKFGATVIREKKQGAVFAYNTGMQHSSGKIIAVTDADSRPDPYWLEKILNIFQNNKIIALTGSVRIDNNSPLIRLIIERMYIAFIRGHFLLRKPHLSGFNFAVRREFFDKIGGLNTAYRMSPEVNLGLCLQPLGEIIFAKDVIVTTSTRRWKNGLIKTLFEYMIGYFYTVWLRRPPPIKQAAIRI